MSSFRAQCLLRHLAFGKALSVACNLAADSSASTHTAVSSFSKRPPPQPYLFSSLQSVITKQSQTQASNDESCLFHSCQSAEWEIILLNSRGATTDGEGFLNPEFHNRGKSTKSYYQIILMQSTCDIYMGFGCILVDGASSLLAYNKHSAQPTTCHETMNVPLFHRGNTVKNLTAACEAEQPPK